MRGVEAGPLDGKLFLVGARIEMQAYLYAVCTPDGWVGNGKSDGTGVCQNPGSSPYFPRLISSQGWILVSVVVPEEVIGSSPRKRGARGQVGCLDGSPPVQPTDRRSDNKSMEKLLSRWMCNQGTKTLSLG